VYDSLEFSGILNPVGDRIFLSAITSRPVLKLQLFQAFFKQKKGSGE
jgi:hypothetical protein